MPEPVVPHAFWLTPEVVTLGAYRPTKQVEDLEVKVRALESVRDFYRDLFNRVVDQRDEYAALADARGKTIHELTEKFREKKERIHAFYGPQLENRKAENRELEDVKRYAKMETESADYWHAQYRQAATAARPAPSIDDSVIQEYEERIGKLLRDVDQAQEAHRSAHRRNVEWVGKNQDLRGELAVAKQQHERLLTSINTFMDGFADGVTTINDAVEEWNEA